MFVLFMDAQIDQTEKPQGYFIVYENVLFITTRRGGEGNKLTEKHRGKNDL